MITYKRTIKKISNRFKDRLMKKVLILNILFILGLLNGNAQEPQGEIKWLIDTCVVVMKSRAVTTSKINWAELKEEALKKASSAKTPYELGPAIKFLYQSIGDFHGRFFYKDSSWQWEPHPFVISDSIMSEWKKGVKTTTIVLPKQIGYLRVPSMPYPEQPEADKAAQALNDSLCSLLQRNVKGIILDLRLDGGGNFAPMISGTSQLFEDGKLGSFVDARGKITNWYLGQNKFRVDTQTRGTIVPKCNEIATRLPVVVLIGPGTGSSGEFFLMALRGRKNTVLLGSKTAGYVTSVEGFAIGDGAYILLSTGFGLDKKGKVYKEAIVPDIENNEPDQFNNLDGDPKIKQAVEWISKRL